MRVDWAIPCMGVRITGGMIESIQNSCWDTLTAPSLPQPLEFIVLVRVVGQPEDFMEDADRRMTAQLTGPGMDELLAIEFEIPSGEPALDHPEGWEAHAHVPVVLQFTPEQPGTYMLALYLNDRWAWSLAFRIAVAGESQS